MELNNYKSTTCGISNDNQKHQEQFSAVRTRKQSIIDGGAKEIVNKLTQLDQLIDQLHNEELAIREQLRKNCLELKNEVDLVESKQRRIQDCLKNIQGL